MKSLRPRFALLCWLALISIAPLACATDADDDGIDDAIDPNPGVADAKTVLTGNGYTLTVLGSNRVCSLQVSSSTFADWNLLNTTGEGRAAVVSKIYEQFGDAFDFVIFVNNTSSSSAPSNQAFNVRNDVRGIGQDVFDDASSVGSAGALQSYIRMASSSAFTTGPILHELLHRWSAFLQGIPRDGADGTHWYFAGTGGQHSGWEPGTLVDLGGGHYKASSPGPFPKFGIASSDFGYGKLDLYLMGLVPASEVPEIQYAENPSIQSDDDFSTGEFSATGIGTISMSEVVDLNGARIPNTINSQKYFHSLFVVLTTAPVTNADWAAYDRQAYEFSLPGDDGNPNFNFYEATGGRAEMSMNYINYDLKSFASPLISGPDAPTPGTPVTYTFPALPGATGYDRRVRRFQPLVFKDGAENGLGNFTPTITGGYNPITDFGRTGKAFRMTHTQPGVDQFLAFKKSVVPTASSKLKFYSLVGMSGSGEFAQVDVRAEGGLWQTIFSQAGHATSEDTFSLKNVSLADYAGKAIEIRFQWAVAGSGEYFIDFDGTNPTLGWFIDDVEVTDCEELTSTNIADLGTDLSFNFTRPDTGRSVLEVRGRIGQRILRWGAEKRIGTAPGANTPPVATDDVVDIRGASKLDLTANDTDADGDKLRIVSVTQGVEGKVKLQKGAVTYTAKSLFDGEDSFTYTISDGHGGESTATVTVHNPFPALSGKYSAAVTQGGMPLGNIDVSLTAGGSLSGKVSLNGKTYAIKGLLDFDGTLTTSIKRKGFPSLSITLEVEFTGGYARIAGTADGGALVIEDTPILAGFSSTLAPAGKYTFLLSSSDTSGLPRGTGYAVGSMSKKGKLKLVGRLADNTAFGTSIALRSNDTAIINLPLYKKPKGYLYGTLTFADLPGSDAAGTLAWSKPQQTPQGSLYPNGFNTTANIVGSIYTPPLRGERVLTYADPNNATVAFTGPELADTLTQAITVSAADKVATNGGNPFSLKLAIDRPTGLFQGSLIPDGAPKKLTFGGALLQKTNLGAGTVSGAAETARVTFTP